MDNSPHHIVPYGSDRVPPQRGEANDTARSLPAGQSCEIGRPGAPIVAIQMTQARPLRMSDLRHPFALPPMAQDLAHAETQLACLRGHLIKLCGLWAKPKTAFIEAYFDAVQAHIAQNEAALTDRIGDLAGLVEPAHWCFAAPMPLPRAHVVLGCDAVPIQVEMLFRDSGGLVAVTLSQGSRTARQTQEQEALDAAGVRIVTLAPMPPSADLLAALGDDFTSFTDGIDLPDSPFHGMGIPAPA
jgi:hypothetical protein